MTKLVCPVCAGSCRVAVPESAQRYKSVMAGYDSATDTMPCRNCGGQYQWSNPTGTVEANRDGIACRHSYVGENVGRCLTKYTCQHCGDSYKIDSGD